MARIKYYNPTTQQREYADRNPLPTGQDGDILVNENGVWVSKPKWQIIYQPVEYIESTGTQYISTGVILKNTIRMVVEQSISYTSASFKVAGVMTNDTTYQGVMCYGNIQQNPGFMSVMYKSFVSPSAASDSDWIRTTVANDGNKHEIELSNGSQKVDNVEYGTDTIASGFTAPYDVSLFGRHNDISAHSPLIAEKIYSCKFYDGDTPIRDFVPVYNVFTGDIGLFDKVESKFYGNKGTGTFLKGADI